MHLAKARICEQGETVPEGLNATGRLLGTEVGTRVRVETQEAGEKTRLVGQHEGAFHQRPVSEMKAIKTPDGDDPAAVLGGAGSGDSASDAHEPAKRTEYKGRVNKRLVILISGRGSNLRAIVEHLHRAELPVDVVSVISNKPDAAGLVWARHQGLETEVIDSSACASRDEYEARLRAALHACHPDLIALAGYMRVLSSETCLAFEGRILNIHPSLLPAYPGLHTHARALAEGAKEHGATVHMVSAELDAGPILSQARVPIREGDTPESLADRVLQVEHAIYPVTVAAVLGGLLRWDGQRWLKGSAEPGFESVGLPTSP